MGHLKKKKRNPQSHLFWLQVLLSFAGSDPGADVFVWDWPLPSAWLSLHVGTTEKRRSEGWERRTDEGRTGTTAEHLPQSYLYFLHLPINKSPSLPSPHMCTGYLHLHVMCSSTSDAGRYWIYILVASCEEKWPYAWSVECKQWKDKFINHQLCRLRPSPCFYLLFELQVWSCGPTFGESWDLAGNPGALLERPGGPLKGSWYQVAWFPAAEGATHWSSLRAIDHTTAAGQPKEKRKRLIVYNMLLV